MNVCIVRGSLKSCLQIFPMHVSLYDRVSFVPFVPSRVGRFTRLIDYDEDAIELLISCVLRSILCI
jgi:hypothetical protein